MKENVLMFAGDIFLFLGPMLYQRMNFRWNRTSFDDISQREKTGMQIHHGHWGIVFAFISTGALLFGWRNWVTIGFTCLGWGFMLDEVLPMLRMPSVGRPTELEVYAKSERPTYLLFGIVTLCAIAAGVVRYLTASPG